VKSAQVYLNQRVIALLVFVFVSLLVDGLAEAARIKFKTCGKNENAGFGPTF
jgi:hypothetical protein